MLKKENYNYWFSEEFQHAFNHTIKFEGGYVNDPTDPGGETNFGISKRAYPYLNIKDLTLDDVRKIYYDDYWVKNKCDTFVEMIAIKLFDLSVNMGLKQAAILLQRAVRASDNIILTEDGKIGPKTINAINNTENAYAVLSALKAEAASFYKGLAEKNISQKKYINGWLRRAYA